MCLAIPGVFISRQAHDLNGADTLQPCINADTIVSDNVFGAAERVIQLLQQVGKAIAILPKSNRITTCEEDKGSVQSTALDRDILR